MELHKSYIVLGLLVAFALFFGIMAHADEANEQIKVTFNVVFYSGPDIGCGHLHNPTG